MPETVTTTLPRAELEPLLEPARRYCYVSNTIAQSPPIDIEIA